MREKQDLKSREIFDETVSESEKTQFRSAFKLCDSYKSRSAFIYANIRSTQLFLTSKKKSYTLFHLQKQQICQISFCEILQIDKKRIVGVIAKQNLGKLEDLRGIAPRNTLPESSRHAMTEHIYKFLRYCSHYRRESTSANFLDPELNLLSSYSRIFKSTELKFKQLKSDTCKTCDILANKIKQKIWWRSKKSTLREGKLTQRFAGSFTTRNKRMACQKHRQAGIWYNAIFGL